MNAVENRNTSIVSVSLNSDTLSKLDAFADSRGLSRSSVISFAVADFLKAHEYLPEVKSIFSEFFNSFSSYAKGDISREQFSDVLSASEERLKDFSTSLK